MAKEIVTEDELVILINKRISSGTDLEGDLSREVRVVSLLRIDLDEKENNWDIGVNSLKSIRPDSAYIAQLVRDEVAMIVYREFKPKYNLVEKD